MDRSFKRGQLSIIMHDYELVISSSSESTDSLTDELDSEWELDEWEKDKIKEQKRKVSEKEVKTFFKKRNERLKINIESKDKVESSCSSPKDCISPKEHEYVSFKNLLELHQNSLTLPRGKKENVKVYVFSQPSSSESPKSPDNNMRNNVHVFDLPSSSESLRYDSHYNRNTNLPQKRRNGKKMRYLKKRLKRIYIKRVIHR